MSETTLEIKDGWISCEEGFPDKNGKYLCCYDNDFIEIVEYDSTVMDDGYFPFSFWLWSIEMDEFGNHLNEWIEIDDVKYWQPLPEKPGRSE